MAMQVELVASGLDAPTYAASPPGSASQLFITEKDSGRVVVLDLATNQVWAQAFFDIPAAQMSSDGEGGLLGLAFHPDYAANGKVYLHLTNEAGDNELWEMTRSASNPAVADPASARVLMTIDRTATNHVGGWIGFGPDGYLYIASGDSGGSGDPQNAAQNLNDLRGKLLRIDVNSDAFPGDAGRNYAIPAGNPFVGVEGADEIFVYGLRNPWRASFDRATGDLYIGDVGQSAREEIDFLAAGTGAGTNFGWRVMEGTRPTGYAQLDNPSANDPSLTPPIHEYGREEGGSIIGGYVYRGPGSAQGEYFFADFLSNHVWTARVVDGDVAEVVLRDGELVFVNGGTLDMIVSFAEDSQGRLYVIGLDGELFRLTPIAEEATAVQFSALSDGQAISFNPAIDVLNFDQQAIAAADIRVSASGAADTRIDVVSGPHAGKDVLLVGVSPLQLATSNVTFATGSRLVIGDNSTALNDDAGNQLVGTSGRDLLMGFGGDDTLVAGAGDVLDGGTGFDTIDFAAATSAIVVDFGSGTINGSSISFTNVESVIGGSFPDHVTGSAGAQNVSAGGGADTLWGAGGVDTLAGGSGADTFLFRETGTADADRIGDFASGVDKIRLDATAMPALGGSGTFAMDDPRFYAAPGARGGHDANDRVVYDTSAGELFYDADGSGSGTAQLVATLQSGATLLPTDIDVTDGSTNVSLIGGAAGEWLVGGEGKDTLDGREGNDTLIGGGQSDIFLFTVSPGTANADSILDFTTGVDKVVLDGTVHLNSGPSGAFTIGDARFHSHAGANVAHDLITRVIYDTTTGELWYDADGSGAAPTLLVATVHGVAATDIVVVNGGTPGARIDGTSGNDTLSGTAGDDTINGLGGNDLVLAGSTGGNDVIDGGTGFDSIEFRERATSAVVVDYRTGTITGGSYGTITFTNLERVVAGNFNDSLTGNAAGQVLNGYGGADTLWGAGGVDTLWGSSGADTFVFRETGTANADRVSDFGSGSDKILLDASVMDALGASGNFTAGDARFAANSTGTAQDASDRIVFNTTTKQVFYDADGSGSGAAVLIATLQSGATLVATDILVEGGTAPGGGQTINGTAGNDSLVGGPGDDTINGFAGDDTLDGQAGNDVLDGGTGNNRLIGGDGNDTLIGGGTVDGGDGVDTQIMASGIAGAGIERLILRGYEFGADGHGNELDNVIIDEGPGNAYLYGNGGDDTLIGGSGFNFFVFHGDPSGSSDAYGHDSVDGGGGLDWLGFEGNGVAVTVDFRTGTVTGGSAAAASVTFTNVEAAVGTLLDDVLIGGDGGNRLLGYGGNDTLTGGAGADNILGDDGFGHPPVSPGNDRIFGGGGNDFISGQEGDDWVDGGAGNDSLGGREGMDSFVFSAAPGGANADQIDDFSSADDQIVLDGTVHANSGPSGTFATDDPRFWSSTSGTAHDADDRVIYNTSTRELWYDADGNGSGAALLIATLQTGATLVATDIEVVNGSTTPPGEVINGTSGNDTLSGTAGNDTINGLGGSDLLLAGSTGGADLFDAGAGFDSIEFRERATSAVVVDYGTGMITDGSSGTISFTNVERIVAGNFADSLTGNASGQILTGYGGADTLWGAGGADTLWGSAGTDTFVFREMGTANADRVSDWASGVDTLALDNAAMSALGADGEFVAGDARFAAGAGFTSGRDDSDRVVFDTSTGRLYYDADGSGSGAAQLIATVQSGASVAATDIVVI